MRTTLAFDQQGLESLLQQRAGGVPENTHDDREIELMVRSRLEEVFRSLHADLVKLFKPAARAGDARLSRFKKQNLHQREAEESVQEFFGVAGFADTDELVNEMVRCLCPQLLKDARNLLNVERVRAEQVMEMIGEAGWDYLMTVVRTVLIQHRALHSVLQVGSSGNEDDVA